MSLNGLRSLILSVVQVSRDRRREVVFDSLRTLFRDDVILLVDSSLKLFIDGL